MGLWEDTSALSAAVCECFLKSLGIVLLLSFTDAEFYRLPWHACRAQ